MPTSEISTDPRVPAVTGVNTGGGDGLSGRGRRGVVGTSDDYQGVYGLSRDNAGVVGESAKMHAIFGITHSNFAGVFGTSDAGGTGVAGESAMGIGVHGKGKQAGLFEGSVKIQGGLEVDGVEFKSFAGYPAAAEIFFKKILDRLNVIEHKLASAGGSGTNAPYKPITLSVENESNGLFLITSVLWQLWKIGFAQPPAGIGSTGVTATITPSAGFGWYGVTAFVSVIRVANGGSELSTFFGNTGHIHQFQYSGSAVSKTFRLVAEGDGSGLYNPVVHAND